MYTKLVMTPPQSLSEFVVQEIKRRGVSYREFASDVGVSHVGLLKLIDGDTTSPSVEFVLKLAKETGENPITLLALAYPQLQGALKALSGLESSTLLRSERIEQLPRHLRDAVDVILFERSNLADREQDV